MRRYEDGAIVGEEAPPIDFLEWLRSETEQAEGIAKDLSYRSFSGPGPRPALRAIASINARVRALHEVQWAYARSQEQQ